MTDDLSCPNCGSHTIEPGELYEVDGSRKRAGTCMKCGSSLATGSDGRGPWRLTKETDG